MPRPPATAGARRDGQEEDSYPGGSMNKLKPKLPSPAMVVALIALVLAMTGSAVAALDASSVNGIRAVPAGTSLRRAAGKVVATNKSGSARGQIPSKYLDIGGAQVIKGQGMAQVFGASIDVVDQNTTVPQALIRVPFFGTLTVSCKDENAKKGVEDPQSTVSFANQSGNVLALARTGSGGVPSVFTNLPNTAIDTFTLSNAHTYEYNIQSPGGTNVLVHGVVNQIGRGTAAAQCNEYGQALRVG
jgi:hypothetical protein